MCDVSCTGPGGNLRTSVSIRGHARARLTVAVVLFASILTSSSGDYINETVECFGGLSAPRRRTGVFVRMSLRSARYFREPRFDGDVYQAAHRDKGNCIEKHWLGVEVLEKFNVTVSEDMP